MTEKEMFRELAGEREPNLFGALMLVGLTVSVYFTFRMFVYP